MAITLISLKAKRLDVEATLGDDILLRFRFWNEVAYITPQPSTGPAIDVPNSTLLSLSGWGPWQASAKLRDGTLLPFDVDTTEQPSSIITLKLAGTDIREKIGVDAVAWDFQTTDPAGAPGTLYAGLLRIDAEATV